MAEAINRAEHEREQVVALALFFEAYEASLWPTSDEDVARERAARLERARRAVLATGCVNPAHRDLGRHRHPGDDLDSSLPRWKLVFDDLDEMATRAGGVMTGMKFHLIFSAVDRAAAEAMAAEAVGSPFAERVIGGAPSPTVARWHVEPAEEKETR